MMNQKNKNSQSLGCRHENLNWKKRLMIDNHKETKGSAAVQTTHKRQKKESKILSKGV